MRDHDALLRFIAERADLPFVWGSAANDCGSYAAGAVLAQTGRNPFAGLKWTSEKQLRALLRKLGGLENAMSARLRQVPVAQAHRGDVAAVLSDGELGLMIVEGITLVGPGRRREVRRPRGDMVMAWSAE